MIDLLAGGQVLHESRNKNCVTGIDIILQLFIIGSLIVENCVLYFCIFVLSLVCVYYLFIFTRAAF